MSNVSPVLHLVFFVVVFDVGVFWALFSCYFEIHKSVHNVTGNHVVEREETKEKPIQQESQKRLNSNTSSSASPVPQAVRAVET